jgi:hypothetical protein
MLAQPAAALPCKPLPVRPADSNHAIAEAIAASIRREYRQKRTGEVN